MDMAAAVWRMHRGNLADHHVRGRRDSLAGLFQTSQRSLEPARIALVTALVLATGAGCASRQGRGFADRFVVHGVPAVDLTAPPGTPDTPGLTPVAPSPPPAAKPVSRPRVAATLEDSAPLLRARLAALAVAPTPDAHLDAAAAYRAFGVLDRAFDLIREGLTRYPRNARLHVAAAALWRDWGFPERGLRDAHLAVRYAPTAAEAHTTLATLLWAVGARRHALAAFADAARLDPDAAYAHENWCRAARALAAPLPAGCPAGVPPP